jgi:hypothetical protein
MSAVPVNWIRNGYAGWQMTVRTLTPKGHGTYSIYLVRRPSYCDRGDWLIQVSHVNADLDEQDGFPRYFFGSVDEAKAQMETWLLRREAYRAALN